jgi:DNA polymerase-3 subunit alpha
MSTQPQFCHLHLHTDFSLLDGAIQHGPLAKHVAELGMPAVAITDHGNLFGAISFYNSMKAQQVKPIIGMEAYIARESRHKKTAADAPGVGHDGERGMNHLILLASNFTGYQNLVKLSSLAYTEGYYYKPRIDRELLAQHHEGLIALSACLSGVPQSLLLAGKFDDAARAALEFQDIMGKGNYFLEIQDHQIEAQLRINDALIELSNKVEIPLVVTNDCHYLTAQDHEAHDALICLQTGRTVKDRRGMHYSPLCSQRRGNVAIIWQFYPRRAPAYRRNRRTLQLGTPQREKLFADLSRTCGPYR